MFKIDSVIRPVLSRSIVRRASRYALQLAGVPPTVGNVRWGGLRRMKPLSRNFGFDRGKPVDRHYIESFLSDWSQDVAGCVLEVKDATYTRRFGKSRVSRSDVLDIEPANPDATIIKDLNMASGLGDELYDCIIVTQTLQYVYALENGIGQLYRSLKPGGVLLVTAPSITPLRTLDQGWYWNFTDCSIRRLLCERFAPGDVVVRTYGNLMAATAFLYGLSAYELSKDELETHDAEFQVIIAGRAVKAIQ